MDSFYIQHKWSLSLECVSRVTFSSEYGNLNFWQFFEIFRPWPEKKFAVLDGFFPYLAQMITSMRGFVAYDDLWPWPISSRSFGLENHVRSVASTVLDGFFPYLVQMITSMRRCVAYDDLWPSPISSRSIDLDFENCVRSVTFSVLDWLFPYLPQIITTIRWCVVCLVNNKVLKFKYFANFSAYTLKKNLQFCLHFFHFLTWDLIWINGMGNHGAVGVFSERRRSSCSSFGHVLPTCAWSEMT